MVISTVWTSCGTGRHRHLSLHDADYWGGGTSPTWNRYRPQVSVGGRSYVVNWWPGLPPHGAAARSQPSSLRIPRYLLGSRRQGRRAATPHQQSVFLRYTGTRRDAWQDLPEWTYTPLRPTRGFLPAVGGGRRWRQRQELRPLHLR